MFFPIRYLVLPGVSGVPDHPTRPCRSRSQFGLHPDEPKDGLRRNDILTTPFEGFVETLPTVDLPGV